VRRGVPIDGAHLKRLRLRRVFPALSSQRERDLATRPSATSRAATRRAHARPETVHKLAAVLGVEPESLVDLEKL
jgi:hypothetical protein